MVRTMVRCWGKCLKKVDVAYEILKCDFDIVPPDYVVEAIKWLNE